MDIAELKREVPIELLLAHYGASVSKLNSMGWVSMHCPFHEDRDASASVNSVKNRFNCHTCEVRGDIVDIVRKVENFATIGEAKQWLERRMV